MDALLENSRRLLATMRDSIAAGSTEEEWTVFVTHDGQMQMIAGECGSLESLSWTRGARMAWRATHRYGRIVVESRDGARTCRLEECIPKAPVASLVADTRRYAFA